MAPGPALCVVKSGTMGPTCQRNHSWTQGLRELRACSEGGTSASPHQGPLHCFSDKASGFLLPAWGPHCLSCLQLDVLVTPLFLHTVLPPSYHLCAFPECRLPFFGIIPFFFLTLTLYQVLQREASNPLPSLPAIGQKDLFS